MVIAMIKSYIFFMTPMCPNCQEIKEWIKSSGELKIIGKIVDATEDEGMEEARKLGVMSVPTMVFLDEDGKEQARATSLDEIKKIIENKSLLDLG